MLKNHNNSLNTFTALLMQYCLSFIKIFSLLWLSWSWTLTTYASFQALTGGSKRKNVRLGMQRLVFLKTICLGLVLSLISPIASAVNASAEPSLSCLKARVSNVNCTANDFTVGATFSAAPGTPPFCVAGSSFEFLVDLDITSNSPDRYDVGFFVGQSGVSPADLATNDCSVAIFPETPSPWVRLRKNTNTTNVCGDYLGPGQSTTNRIDKIKVNCQGGATGSLTIPYVLVYSQSDADICTGPGDVKPGTASKCQQQDAAPVSGTVAVNVGTYLDVTKETNPDGNSQTFSFTATGPSGSKVIALTGATLTPTSATGGTYTPATIATATNTTTVSISDGQTVRFYMTGLTTSQELKVREDLVTGWEPTPSISCAAVTGAPTFTTPTNLNTPLAEIPFTRIVNLSTTNSAAACTFTNTKR